MCVWIRFLKLHGFYMFWKDNFFWTHFYTFKVAQEMWRKEYVGRNIYETQFHDTHNCMEV